MRVMGVLLIYVVRGADSDGNPLAMQLGCIPPCLLHFPQLLQWHSHMKHMKFRAV
jgi:hypothetical protein